jgi:drug/metabolite transporter (DMT)-like permease
MIISAGLVMLVKGETHFDMAGFTLVMVASCCSGLRFTLTQVFLHGHHENGAELLGVVLTFSGYLFVLSYRVDFIHIWMKSRGPAPES